MSLPKICNCMTLPTASCPFHGRLARKLEDHHNVVRVVTMNDLQQSYLSKYNRAMAALKAIEEAIHELPAPDSEGLTWGNVGDMGRIAEQLEEITKP